MIARELKKPTWVFWWTGEDWEGPGLMSPLTLGDVFYESLGPQIEMVVQGNTEIVVVKSPVIKPFNEVR